MAPLGEPWPLPEQCICHSFKIRSGMPLLIVFLLLVLVEAGFPVASCLAGVHEEWVSWRQDSWLPFSAGFVEGLRWAWGSCRHWASSPPFVGTANPHQQTPLCWHPSAVFSQVFKSAWLADKNRLCFIYLFFKELFQAFKRSLDQYGDGSNWKLMFFITS